MFIDPSNLQPLKLDPGKALSETFSGIGSNYLTILLAGLLFGGIAVVFQFIPYIGAFIYLLISAPLTAGYALLALDAVDENPVEIGTLFLGFGKFGSTLGAGFLTAIPYIVMYAILVGIMLTTSAVMEIDDNGAPSAFFLLFVIVFMLIFMVVTFFASMYFFFTYYLIMDRDLSAVEAVKTSFRSAKVNFGSGLLMVFFAWLFYIVGAVLCYIGLIFTMPFGAYFAAKCYRQVFPKDLETAPIENSPPTPDQYGSAFN